MKKLRKLVTMLAAAAAMVLLPGSFALTASAVEPTTFYIQYDPDDLGWYMLLESEKDDPTAPRKHMDAFYLLARDGDVVVVFNDTPKAPALDLRSVHLSNLTVGSTEFTMISCGAVDEFFTLANGSCSVTAPTVTNAHIYNTSLANFHGNVHSIEVTVPEGEDCKATVGCSGTVDQFKVSFANNTSYSLYNFKADTLSFQDGNLETAQGNFSTDAPAATPVPQTPAPAPAATPVPQTPSDEYDAVPKTGGSNAFVWLLCAAALCSFISFSAKKASR